MSSAVHRRVFLLMVLLFPWFAGAAEFEEGKHYLRLAEPVPTAAPDKIEVVELFWYGCPHCYSLEPRIEAWQQSKPDNVAFVRIPAVLGGRNWKLGARAFYTAEVLGVLEKTHGALFAAIHKDKRTIGNKQQLAEFFAEQGVDKDQFFKAYDSFAVETELRRSRKLVRRYRISGVPAIIVNGKYMVTVSSAGSPDKVFELVDFLVQKEGGAV